MLHFILLQNKMKLSSKEFLSYRQLKSKEFALQKSMSVQNMTNHRYVSISRNISYIFHLPDSLKNILEMWYLFYSYFQVLVCFNVHVLVRGKYSTTEG
jgi:hypothetical protein